MLGEKVQVDLTKLYLARFSKDGEWYRAAPRSGVDPNGQVGENVSLLSVVTSHSAKVRGR